MLIQIWITLLLIGYAVASIAEIYFENTGTNRKILSFLEFAQQSIIVAFAVTVAALFVWLIPGIVSRW